MVAIIFMVAGMSSRFGGKPKQLEKIGPNDESLIEYSVNQALKNNFKEYKIETNKIMSRGKCRGFIYIINNDFSADSISNDSDFNLVSFSKSLILLEKLLI